jgi:hypothetical protein
LAGFDAATNASLGIGDDVRRAPRARSPRVLEPRVLEPRVLEPRVLELRVLEPRVREPRALEPRCSARPKLAPATRPDVSVQHGPEPAAAGTVAVHSTAQANIADMKRNARKRMATTAPV